MPPQLGCHNAGYVELLHQDFLRDPSRVAEPWQAYFRANDGDAGGASAPPRPAPMRSSIFNPPAIGQHPDAGQVQERVSQLIRAYRVRGHLAARLDPLDVAPRQEPGELSLAYHGLSEADLDRTFATSAIGGPESQSLRELIDRLRSTYCR